MQLLVPGDALVAEGGKYLDMYLLRTSGTYTYVYVLSGLLVSVLEQCLTTATIGEHAALQVDQSCSYLSVVMSRKATGDPTSTPSARLSLSF